MLDVQRELLPDSYLLIVAPETTDAPEHKLARGLHRATRSGRRLIWVDCSLLKEIPIEAIDLLLAYDFHLRQQSRELVLCHLPESALNYFSGIAPTQRPALAANLLDAHGIYFNGSLG
ncbi:hypothetical protein [Hymenobacter sp. DG25A]|uniref:hypothetical protein n=1 Tax=Hymenobacter sp. DG25A TaxID=1385663 RepID=UPI0006BDDCD6|nr:hypothetical protein [Hymenobacter sp. DG25A]ALD21119.1 hypothetical protein AM218_07705 [Hymenobacter sp. DG25A]